MTYSRCIFNAIIFSLLCISGVNARIIKEERYVVVVSLDGFRSDYPAKTSTPTLDSIANVGVKSGFRPCFPSQTFPNHYSMATGLYPDHHGLIGNKFYDSQIDKVYHKNEDDIRFFGGEPIWNTAERQGVKSATYYWVGSDRAINNRRPSRWKPYNKATPFSNRADSVISWLQLPDQERPHLIMWYVEEPDGISHVETPDSEATLQTVHSLDSLLGAFISKARKLEIYPLIDFVIVSDHGMATYYPELSVDLNNYLSRDSFDYIFDGTPTFLYPKPSYTNTAYDILKTVPYINVYRKDEIPERYHYGENKRIPPLLVVPKLGTQIFFSKNHSKEKAATHGYDNYLPEMEGIFYAFGPSIKRKYEMDVMDNINLHLIIANLLNITPAPNDGDQEIVNQILIDRK